MSQRDERAEAERDGGSARIVAVGRGDRLRQGLLVEYLLREHCRRRGMHPLLYRIVRRN